MPLVGDWPCATKHDGARRESANSPVVVGAMDMHSVEVYFNGSAILPAEIDRNLFFDLYGEEPFVARCHGRFALGV